MAYNIVTTCMKDDPSVSLDDVKRLKLSLKAALTISNEVADQRGSWYVCSHQGSLSFTSRTVRIY